MRQILILSGKGGTGKTSLTASFACLAGDCVLADCDVDAADLHLLVGGGEGEERQDFLCGLLARLDPDRCTGCGRCVTACRFDALVAAAAGGPPRVDATACEGCGLCLDLCPDEAITLEQRHSGWLRVSGCTTGTLVDARLQPGAGNSGKLVTQVRNRAREEGVTRGCDMVIIDGPPGIGCPAVASLAGVDLVVLVAEPSLSGLHDFLRALGLVRHFHLPAVVVINKHDLVPDLADRLAAICTTQELTLAGRIPYDPAVTAAVVAGRPLVEMHPDSPAAEAVRQAWAAIQVQPA